MPKGSACTLGVIILIEVKGIKLFTLYLYLYSTMVPTFREYFRRIGMRPRADRSQLIGASYFPCSISPVFSNCNYYYY